MNIYVGITDKNWFEQLRIQKSDEVNFWSPGSQPFRAVREHELFLFKLHAPDAPMDIEVKEPVQSCNSLFHRLSFLAQQVVADVQFHIFHMVADCL